MSFPPITTEVLDLHAELTEIQIELDGLPLCHHTPLGVLKDVCRRCALHARGDAIDRALERLMVHVRAV